MPVALIVEYDGTNYHGFQYQPNAISIQEELEKAIRRFTGETIRIKAAGRTDTGVHALGQVVALKTKSDHSTHTFVQALNALLPDDIAIKAAYKVKDGFDPRRHAISRKYRYTILNAPTPSPLSRRTVLTINTPLDIGSMKKAANLMKGEHDWHAFCGPINDVQGCTVRNIYQTAVNKIKQIVTFDIESESFLPHQVRRMTGALVDIGLGKLLLKELQYMIDGRNTKTVARRLPALGLCLMEVTYLDFPSKVD